MNAACCQCTFLSGQNSKLYQRNMKYECFLHNAHELVWQKHLLFGCPIYYTSQIKLPSQIFESQHNCSLNIHFSYFILCHRWQTDGLCSPPSGFTQKREEGGRYVWAFCRDNGANVWRSVLFVSFFEGTPFHNMDSSVPTALHGDLDSIRLLSV